MKILPDAGNGKFGIAIALLDPVKLL